MKKVLIVILVLMLSFNFTGCGKSDEVIAVEECIASIGEITRDNFEESMFKIEEALVLYDALPEKDRSKVENYDDLQGAIDTSVYISEQVAAEEALICWETDYYVDEFGDDTDDYYMRGEFEGNFSNSATSGSDLAVYMFCDPEQPGHFSLRLIEYGSHIANVDEGSDIVIKVKIDDVVYDADNYYPDEIMVIENDIYIWNDCELFDVILKSLDEGKEFSCLIEITEYSLTNKYNFTIKPYGLSEIPHNW